MKRNPETSFASSWKFGLFCILFALFGCAAAPAADAPAPVPVNGLVACFKHASCTLVRIQNFNTQAATITVNGFRVDVIEGNSSAIWALPLDAARCAAVVIVLRISNDYASAKECPSPGEALTLDIETAPVGTPFQVWLNRRTRIPAAAKAIGTTLGEALDPNPDYFHNVRPNGRDKVDSTQRWVVVYPQPPKYRGWWRDIATCEGLKLDVERAARVRFVFINSESFRLAGQFQHFHGLTDPKNATIYVARPQVDSTVTVEHEMAHMLDAWNDVDEGDDAHPADVFETCGLHSTYP